MSKEDELQAQGLVCVKPVRLTAARMNEAKAPGGCSWWDWGALPAIVQWFHAQMESREAEAMGMPCPIENMQDAPKRDPRLVKFSRRGGGA